MQVTKLRKYKNNYEHTYGRITINEKLVKMFLGDTKEEVIDVIVEYDAEKDQLIIKKIVLD